MKFKEYLIEQHDYSSDKQSLISLVGSLTSVINTAAADYPNLFAEHQNHHKVKLVLQLRMSRWFMNNYLSAKRQSGIQSILYRLSENKSLKPETRAQLNKLSKLKIRGIVNIGDKRGTVDNFFELARGLPKAINNLGRDLKNERITSAGSYLMHAVNKYDSTEQQIKKDSKQALKHEPKQPKNQMPGQQLSQSEQIVNDVLNTIKSKTIRNEIRSKLAKRDNKLQLLQQLMKEYGLS